MDVVRSSWVFLLLPLLLLLLFLLLLASVLPPLLAHVLLHYVAVEAARTGSNATVTGKTTDGSSQGNLGRGAESRVSRAPQWGPQVVRTRAVARAPANATDMGHVPHSRPAFDPSIALCFGSQDGGVWPLFYSSFLSPACVPRLAWVRFPALVTHRGRVLFMCLPLVTPKVALVFVR